MDIDDSASDDDEDDDVAKVQALRAVLRRKKTTAMTLTTPLQTQTPTTLVKSQRGRRNDSTRQEIKFV